MKRPMLAWLLGIFLVVAAGAADQVSEAPRKPGQKPEGPPRYQLVLFKLGPAWQKGKPLVQQPGIQEHATYVQKLIKEGALVLGGPLLDEKNQVFTGAMMILALATPDDAQRALEADPAVKSEVFQVDKIETMVITGTSWRPAVPKE